MSEKKNGIAQVTGILKYNNDTREEMLRRNYWKDEEYTKYGTGIGVYHNIETKEISPITEGKDLYTYTQDETTKYGHEINKKYFYRDIKKLSYETTPYEGDIRKWDGNYVDIFSDNNKLGEIADFTYLQLMTFAGYANSDRFLKDKYLTPGLISFYGSNPQIEGDNGYFNVFNRVGGVYNHETGRIADIAESEAVKIVHEYSQGISNNGGTYYLENQIKENYRKGYIPKYGLTYTTEEIPVLNKKGEEKRYKSGKKKGEVKTETKETFGLSQYTEYTKGENEYTGRFTEKFNLLNKKSILSKTSDLFKKYDSKKLFNRNVEYDNNTEGDYFDTGKNYIFGHSHGRTLTVLDSKIGDKEPFCRNWTWYKQYSKYSDTIRPFRDNSTIADLQYMNKDFRAARQNGALKNFEAGDLYLANNTVLGNNGLVNITPSSKGIDGNGDGAVDIKKCMFSIENLAWKDVSKKDENISSEQIGENGGRIMWFPPYDLDFQENITVDWEQSSFIGRGEKVYTYKNTDRTGTLSFSMLIDHPAIINSLQGKKGMGEEDDLEADVLRFFAGCKKLDLQEKENNEDKEQNIQDDSPKEVPNEDTQTIKFYVFFPNNYSGNGNEETEGDWNTKGFSDTDWYFYLLFGKGINTVMLCNAGWTGYEMAAGKGLGEAYPKGISSTPECIPWTKITQDGGKIFNYRVDFDLRKNLKYDSNYKDDNSYQLNSKLIGNEDILKDANYSFAEVMTAMLLKEFSGSLYVEKAEPEEIEDLADFIDTTLSQGDATAWKISEENYKTDDGRIIDLYVGNDSYYYEKKVGKYVMYSKLGKYVEQLQEAIVIGSEGGTSYEMIKEHAVNCGAREDKINELIDLFKSEGFKPSSITVNGCSTNQDSSNSKLLSKRRRKALATILNNFFKDNENKAIEGDIIEPDNLNDKTTVNSKEAKAQRYAVVEIKYNQPEVNKASETSDSSEDAYIEEMSEDDINYDAQEISEEIGVSYEMLVKYEELTAVPIISADKKRARLLCTFASTTEGLESLFNESEGYRNEIYFIMDSKESMEKDKKIYIYADGSICSDKLKQLEKEYFAIPENKRKMSHAKYKELYNEILSEYDYILSTEFLKLEPIDIDEEPFIIDETIDEELEKSVEDEKEEALVAAKKLYFHNWTDKRYENEAEYFYKLSKESPLVFNNIVDKFKYFSPAFHSISPEGFNARLTFLQQCTRQGQTIENSKSKNGVIPSNLSFGRMPVCVLKIGDFINTKIIIQNISINYGENGGIQWDLNPEGAGVQPMYAKISMGIVIIGGQSLTGPISRLQNAVSFDYYANAGVYDNRADRRINKGNGKEPQYNIWTPTADTIDVPEEE